MNTNTILIAGGVIVVLVVIVLLIVAVRRRPANSTSLESRLAEYSERETPVTLEEIELSASFADRIVYPTLDKIASILTRLTPAKTLAETERKLELAENPGNLTPTRFYLIRFVAMIVLSGLFFVVMTLGGLPFSRRLMFAGGAAALGFYLPVVWLSGKIRTRQEAIVKQLPDALDLLTICVEAGLGFDQAVGKLVEKSENELSRSFNRYLHEVRLGKSRQQALQNMSERMDVPDATQFIAAIIQADQLGVSMAKILSIQSQQMRILRRQRAEQKAHQAPVKMVFPMVFLIFPAIFIVLLGPAVLLIMESGIFGSIV